MYTDAPSRETSIKPARIQFLRNFLCTYDSSVKEGSRAAVDYQAALTAGREKITGLEGEIKVLEMEIALAFVFFRFPPDYP